MNGARQRRKVTVSGVVQGVYFRQSCRAMAVAHGLAGHVRNRHDGRVEAVFEGTPAEVDAAVEWCRHGPPEAVVTAVEIVTEPAEGVEGFVILPTA